jgi:hypothetical protein
VLHVGIAATMGLYSFSAAMIGLVVLAYNPRADQAAPGPAERLSTAEPAFPRESLERTG